MLRFFALLGCWHCNGEMYASLNNENEILPRLSRYFHHQQFSRDYLVLAVITEVGRANVLEWTALVAQLFELGDEWQVSKLPVAATPSGHGDDQWRAGAQLGVKISEKMADDMVARGTHSAEFGRSRWGREGLAKVCLADNGAELPGACPLVSSGISLSNVLHRARSSRSRAALPPDEVLAGIADHLRV